jgi:pentatricopeptide repeat protein
LYAKNDLHVSLDCHNIEQDNCKSNTIMLSAYANLEALDQGRQFHAHVITTGFESNAIVGSALVDMYSKSGSRADARRVFDRLPERDAVVWNTMISGYSQNDYCDEALKLFSQMLRGGMKPDECSFVCVLSACGGLAARDQGKQIYAVIIRTEFASYVSVGNALVTLHAKCGSIEDARHMFNKMPKQDSVTCNAMIAGYAQHGCGMEALRLFEEMGFSMGYISSHETSSDSRTRNTTSSNQFDMNHTPSPKPLVQTPSIWTY